MKVKTNWDQAKNLLYSGMVKQVAYKIYPDCIFFLNFERKVVRLWRGLISTPENTASSMAYGSIFIYERWWDET